MTDMMKRLERTQQERAASAVMAQGLIEQIYPMGSLVEFVADGEWRGRGAVVENRIGYVGASHTPRLKVCSLEDGSISEMHYEYVRPAADQDSVTGVVMVNADEHQKHAFMAAIEEARKLFKAGELETTKGKCCAAKYIVRPFNVHGLAVNIDAWPRQEQ